MAKMLHSAVAMASLALSTSMTNAAEEKFCSFIPLSYAPAKIDYPELAFAIEVVEQHPLMAWYTDRQPEADKQKMLKSFANDCPEDSRLTVVVYGIPNKDCHGNHSSDGTSKTTADYKAFLSELTTVVGTRKALYIVEPDSVGLLAEKDGCGAEAGYEENLKIALAALSVNPNSEVYLDIGYWIVANDEQLPEVAKIFKILAAFGRLKGIALNTSNYRSTKEMSDLCARFQKAVGSTEVRCIVDTSRNFLEPVNTEWCNVLPAGIGTPPTSDTKYPNLSYFMWIKVPGESDGECNGGPGAGKFFDKAFQTLWDDGYFVKKLGMNTISQGGSGNPAGDGSSYEDPSTKADESGPTQNTGSLENEPDEEEQASPSSETPISAETLPEESPATSTMKCNVKNRIR